MLKRKELIKGYRSLQRDVKQPSVTGYYNCEASTVPQRVRYCW